MGLTPTPSPPAAHHPSITMPSIFEKVGKPIKDLLTGDYTLKQQLKISGNSDAGALKANSTIKGSSMTSDATACFKWNNKLDLETKVDTASKISIKAMYNPDVDNVTVTTNTSLPGFDGDAEVLYKKGGQDVSTTVGFSIAPKISVCYVNSKLADNVTAACEVGYDAAKGSLSKYGALVQYTKGDAIFLAKADDKFDSFKVSMLHNTSADFSWAAELSKKMSKGETTMTIGTACKLDGGSSVKAKIDSHGVASAVYKVDVRKGLTFAA